MRHRDQAVEHCCLQMVMNCRPGSRLHAEMQASAKGCRYAGHHLHAGSRIAFFDLDVGADGDSSQ
jgi:hypothetical protein